MYEQFFGLRERPFTLSPNPRFAVLTDGHREAITNIEYGIASRQGITLLVGDAGLGKTTVIRYAIARQPRFVHCVHLNNPSLTREEFVEMLAVQFKLPERAQASKALLLFELEQALRRRHEAGETAVLIVDEAQKLPVDLLEEVRLLANIETDDTKLLPIVLAGHPDLVERLNDPSFRQLKQRITLRCELRALTPTETIGYLVSRIRASGGSAVEVLTAQAATLIYEASEGVPRTINVIAENALLTAFALGQRPVSQRVVLDVLRDFDLDRAIPRGLQPVAQPSPGRRPHNGTPVSGPPAPQAADVAVSPELTTRPNGNLAQKRSLFTALTGR